MAEITGAVDGQGKRFAVVASRFNEVVVGRLVEGALECLAKHGVAPADVDVVWVPGAWELPAAAQRVLRARRYDGIVALGCVIRGETPHFDFVAGEASRGLAELARSGDVPVTFGLLTTDDTDQALARAGGKSGNKGWDAAIAALELTNLYQMLEAGSEGA